MRKSQLYKRSVFFIDIFNVLLYIDLFLYYEIRKRAETDKVIDRYFSNLPNIPTNHINDAAIIQSTSSKLHLNILEDWIDKETFLKYNSKETYRDYLMDLYYDMLTNPKCNEYIQLTEFGNAVKMIIRDINTTKVVLYMPFKSKFIEDNVTDLFLGYNLDKIIYYVGRKDNQAEDFKSDLYVFEDVRDIDEVLKIKHNDPIEVIIPTYEYNLMDNRDKLEKMVEQVTAQRLRLIEPIEEYQKKYNLSINTIDVPI